tara:strand:- start:61 stop:783 length:723 start_codon:yes stop_codon:yes gene_type:complete
MGKSKDLATGNSAAYVETAGDTMTGNLGIGGSPSVNLDVSSSGNTFALVKNTSSGSGLYIKADTDGDSEIQTAGGNNNIIFRASGVERMQIDSSGRVTTPSQPSFYAYPSASSTEYTYNQWNVIQFNSTGWNVGNCFNTSNYRFTAPVTGKYLMTWMFQLENSNQPAWIYAYPIVNGNRSTDRTRGVSFSDFKVMPDYHTENGSWIMNLTANDYVTMDIITSGSAKAFKAESHWTGILLG